MKSNRPDAEKILADWQEERHSAFDGVDLTTVVMASIQLLAACTAISNFQSSPWLEAPSMLVGLLRSSLALFVILIPT